MRITEDVPFAGKWDIIVVGGGVAGVAAAVSAARAGKKTLITEKNAYVRRTGDKRTYKLFRAHVQRPRQTDNLRHGGRNAQNVVEGRLDHHQGMLAQ